MTKHKSKSIGKVFRKEYPRVYEYIKGDYTYYRIDCRGNGWKGSPYEQRKTKDEALERAREIERLVKQYGVNGVIHDEDARLYRELVARVAPFNMRLGDVVEDWINFRSDSVINAASKTVNELADDWYNEKTKNKLKPLADKSIKELDQTRKNLIDAFDTLPIKLVTKEKMEYTYTAWEAKGISLSTIRNNYGKMFKSFFSWCIRKEYIKKNPCDTIEITVPERNIKIFDITDAETICQRLRTEEKNKKMTPYVVLSMFMGLRPNEAAQITWADIKFETKEITIRGGLSKVRRTRHLKMPDNVVAWLKPFQGKPIGNFKNFRKRFESVKRELPEQADILRHTAISFWVAKHKDIDQVAYWMGNSADTIKGHYLEGVKESDVEKFFSLVP